MPSDHARVELHQIRVPHSAILGPEGEGVRYSVLTVSETELTGPPALLQLKTASIFLNENRIRQAAASLGAACYCIKETVEYTKSRVLCAAP